MDKPAKKEEALSLQTFKRLPEYYTYLQAQRRSGADYIAAPAIAREMGLNEVQVRKDLAAVSQSPGKPRKGFAVVGLVDGIGRCLGYNNREKAVLVGAGKLGKALMAYKGFEDCGVCIAAAFDASPRVVGTGAGRRKVLPMEKLPSHCRRQNARIGIITVPARQAQKVCNLLVENGVLAIWNFAPVYLRAPDGVLVRNENMAASLAVLSRRLMGELNQQEKGEPV